MRPPILGQDGRYCFDFWIPSRACHHDKVRYFNVRHDLQQMGRAGRELSPNSLEKQQVSQERGTESGTPNAPDDGDLAHIIDAWTRLSDDQRRRILNVVNEG
jgi:hypothetical protein